MDYQVIWRGFVHDAQGYSRAAREYLLSLDRLGVDVKVEPLTLGTPAIEIRTEQVQRINELIQKPLATDKKKILVYHSQPYGVDPDAERRNGYDYVIINTVWETDLVPDNWFPNINRADAVFIPSWHNYHALRQSGVTVPIHVVPHGADVEMFTPENEALSLEEVKDKFTFLSVFQWQHRKAPEVLIRAYWEEFGTADNTMLIVKTYWSNSPSKADERVIINHLASFKTSLGYNDKNSAPMLITFSMFTDDQLKGLYRLPNVFVLPTRGEGVGLPFIESLSSGVPVIAPRWGGQSDFLNDGNSYPVDYVLESTTSKLHEGVAPNFSDLFNAMMKWAEPSVESLRKQMRYAYENQDEVKEKGKAGRLDMEKMTWEVSGQEIINVIEGLLK
jgi:glycosyltransferase involved in cell wall biosynthesis